MGWTVIAALALPAGASGLTAAITLDPGPAPDRPAVARELAMLPASGHEAAGPLTCADQPAGSGPFDIAINAGATLSANPAALAAFHRAAGQWEAWMTDPVTVNIDADLADMGSGNIIGSTSSVLLVGSYTLIRDQMVADSLDEPDDAIVSAIPTAAQYSVWLPVGIGLNGNLMATKANLKAMGFTGLDADFGASDATVTFNTQFSFDFDNSDGVDPGKIDFETVAAHELGHALGYVSEVDDIDWRLANGLAGDIWPSALDLLRFDNDGASDPSTAGQFTTFPRSMVPNNDEITDIIADEWRMSTGAYTGDGRQASHWKDDSLTGTTTIGIMDPTLSYGQVTPVTEADLYVFDLIGYEIVVPEPMTTVLLALGGLALLRRRRA